MVSNLLTHFSGLEVYITPSLLFNWHGIPITNSILFGWFCSILIVVLLIWISKKVTLLPKGGVIQLFEYAVEFISNTVDTAFEDKSRADKYKPYFVTLFLFFLLSNITELIPGVTGGLTFNGNPLLRPVTADLNATVAAAIITMVFVYASTIREVGFKNYFLHFFVGSPLNPLYLFIGLLEIISDLSRVISLSIRLFLNISIGGVMIAVFAYLGHVVAPVTAAPFYLIELFVDLLQAYIFVLLGVNYLAIAVNHASDHDHLTEDDVPETIKMQPEKA